jgi:hypothetical protein
LQTKITASTSREMQRVTFVESLYNSLKKQTAKAVDDHQRLIARVNDYLHDGLDDSECVEMLIIDGINREAAEGYLSLAKTGGSDSEEGGLYEYSFQFEDTYGKVWSSHDIGKTVKASSSEEAMTKIEEVLSGNIDLEADKIISVNRML